MSDRPSSGSGRESAADHAAGSSPVPSKGRGELGSSGRSGPGSGTPARDSGAAAPSESGQGELATPLPDRGHRALAIGGFATPGTAGGSPATGSAQRTEAAGGASASPARSPADLDLAGELPAEPSPSSTAVLEGPVTGEANGGPTRRARLRTLMVGDYPQLRGLVSSWYLLLTLIVRLPSVILPLTVLT